jgi:hypothetical protein
MFPSGSAGAALLILRLSVAATLLVVGAACCTFAESWTSIAAVVLAAGLCFGLLTPYCACLCCLMELRTLLISGRDTWLLLALSILNGIVLALIGPGAYSLDSHIFGRQLVSLPPRRKASSD